jgi:hypothetical protein
MRIAIPTNSPSAIQSTVCGCLEASGRLTKIMWSTAPSTAARSAGQSLPMSAAGTIASR